MGGMAYNPHADHAGWASQFSSRRIVLKGVFAALLRPRGKIWDGVIRTCTTAAISRQHTVQRHPCYTKITVNVAFGNSFTKISPSEPYIVHYIG